MANENFRKAVLDYGELFIEEITKQLLLNDKVVTGDLINSLDYRVIETVDTITLEILANPYLTVVDKGLKKGTFPNVDNIIKWVNARGIKSTDKSMKTSTQLGWAIAKSIERNGIKPSNVIRKARNSFYANKQALNNVVNAAAIDVKQLIKEAIKNLNN